MSDTHAPTSHTPDAAPATPNWAGLKGLSFTVALVGAGMFVGGGLLRPVLDGGKDIQQWFSSYLTGYIFWLSLPIGSLLLLSVQYLAGGRWGINLRRILEANTRTLWLFMLGFIPIAANFFMYDSSIYWWANRLPTPETDGIPMQSFEETKFRTDNYLNPVFTLVRAGLIFGLWGLMILKFKSLSSKFDATGDMQYRERSKNYAGFFATMFALVTTFAATDWVMSLEPTWFSTMFPVIFATNSFLTTFAFSIIVFLLLQDGGYMPVKHTKQDQINLGSFMLAFTMFWSYTSFSQFLLIWAGNLPEEIAYYLKRSREGWLVMVYALAIFHFALPFVLLLFRNIKENSKRLRMVAFGILIICAVDVFWWIEPTREHNGQWVFWIMSIGAILGVGGLWGFFFIGELSRESLMPTHEAKWLEEEHHHGH